MTTCSRKDIPRVFKVQFKDDTKISKLSILELEEVFDFSFSPELSFESDEERRKVIVNCPYSLKYEWLLGAGSQLEECYRRAMLSSDFSDVVVKWMNETIGYGLFAGSHIPEKSFIGEYTGVLREVDRKHPQLNPYCFHYPTRFWSYHPYVIDAKCKGNLARFINHSNEPNLQPLWIVEKGLLHLILYAKEGIAAGDELTFDYGIGLNFLKTS